MPGHYDSRGIYIFAEDDEASPFSETLNLLGESVSDQVDFLRGDIAGVGTLNGVGLGVVNLSGVTLGTGGTATAVGGTFADLCFYHARITLGTGGNVTGAVTFSPFLVTGAGPWAQLRAGLTARAALGVASMWDTSASRPRPLTLVRHNDALLRVMTADGLDLSSSAPIAWGAGDIITATALLPITRL